VTYLAATVAGTNAAKRETFVRHAFGSVVASLMKEIRYFMCGGDKSKARSYANQDRFDFRKLLPQKDWIGETHDPLAKKPQEREFCTRLYGSMSFQECVRERAMANGRDLFDAWCLRKLETLMRHLKQARDCGLLVYSRSTTARKAVGIPLGGIKGHLWKLPRGVDPWTQRDMFHPAGYRWKRHWFELDVTLDEDRGELRFYKSSGDAWDAVYRKYHEFLEEQSGQAWSALASKKKHFESLQAAVTSSSGSSRATFSNEINRMRSKYFQSQFFIDRGCTSVTIPSLNESTMSDVRTELKTAFPFRVRCETPQNKGHNYIFLCADSKVQRDRWIRAITAFSYHDDLCDKLKTLFTQSAPDESSLRNRIMKLRSQIRHDWFTKNRSTMVRSRGSASKSPDRTGRTRRRPARRQTIAQALDEMHVSEGHTTF